jgi:hypothetical protein
MMNMYRVDVSYYYAEGQTSGHMEVAATSESEAVKSVLDYMQRNMRLYPEYRLHMIQVHKVRSADAAS